MASSSSSSLFFYTLYLSMLCLALIVRNTRGENVVEDVCKKLPHIPYKLCRRALLRIPNSKTMVVEELVRSSMIESLFVALEIKAGIENALRMQGRREKGIFLKKDLQTCLKAYALTVEATKKAIESFEKQNYVEARVQLTAASVTSRNCEEQLEEDLKEKSDEQLRKLNHVYAWSTKIPLAFAFMYSPFAVKS